MLRLRKIHILGIAALICAAVTTLLLMWPEDKASPTEKTTKQCVLSRSPGTQETSDTSVNSSKVTNLKPKTVAITDDEAHPLPDIFPVLVRQNPFLGELLSEIEDNRPEPSRYASITSIDELVSIAEKWHALKMYDRGRFSKANDLKASARRLLISEGKTRPIIYLCLGRLYEDTGLYEAAAHLYNNLINNPDIPSDESLRTKAKFHLAMLEFAKPNGLWSETGNKSIIEPDKLAVDVADDLFGQIIESKADVKTDFGADMQEVARVFRKIIDKHKENAKFNNLSSLQTSLVVAREIYNSNLSSEWERTLRKSIELSKVQSFQKYMKKTSVKNQRIWGTYVAWMLFEKNKYDDVISQLKPMLDSDVWENKDAYLYSQYYLASSYKKTGKNEEAKKITDRIISEGFKFNDMSPQVKDFFTGMSP